MKKDLRVIAYRHDLDGTPHELILGRVTKIGRIGKTPGCWVIAEPGDPGDTHGKPEFVRQGRVRPAIIDHYVCDHPRGTHFCGRLHVTPAMLAELRRQEDALAKERLNVYHGTRTGERSPP